MHLRIYLWLSCVLFAGYVRATKDAVAGKPTEETTVQVQNDAHNPPDHDLFIDADEGSGLETDESSGSGWGAGPGPDDEDGRGSGDDSNGPPDDEDYDTTSRVKETQRTFGDPIQETDDVKDKQAFNELDVEEASEVTDDLVIPEEPETPSTPSAETPIQTTDSNQFYNSFVPNTRTIPSEGAAPEQPRAGSEGEGGVSRTEPDISITGEEVPSVDQEPSGTNVNEESRAPDIRPIMNAKPEDRAASFFAQPGILAAVIGGAVVGLLCAILVVMFIVYRMRKKDEGSYALDEPKRSPAAASYGKGHNNREFYA